MKGIKQAKILSRTRVALESVLPLETPFSVEIDICSACNLRCNFCFHGDADQLKKSRVQFGLMDMDLFTKIIDDLKNFPSLVKKVKLFEFGEPLLNPHLPEMISYVRENNAAEFVEITTNGLLLNEELNLALIEAGLSRINISVNAITEDKFKEITERSLNLSEYIANIKHLYEHKKDCHIYIKLADDGKLTQADEDEFYSVFGDLCDEIFVERLSPIWRDTQINSALEGTLGPYGQQLDYKLVCPLIFTRMVINYDGVVVACCVDWKRSYPIGDISKKSAYDIWNGPELTMLQLSHLKGERESIPICKGCTALSSCTTDDIDEHASLLIGRFENKLELIK